MNVDCVKLKTLQQWQGMAAGLKVTVCRVVELNYFRGGCNPFKKFMKKYKYQMHKAQKIFEENDLFISSNASDPTSSRLPCIWNLKGGTLL